MCGGTHVKNTSEIRGLTVTKIKKVLALSLLCCVISSLSHPEQEEHQSIVRYHRHRVASAT